MCEDLDRPGKLNRLASSLDKLRKMGEVCEFLEFGLDHILYGQCVEEFTGVVLREEEEKKGLGAHRNRRTGK